MWFSEKHITKMNNFRFLCEVCGFETKDKKTASNHKQEHTQQQHFKCDKCNKTIKRKFNFLKHVREQHGTNRFSCNQCNYTTNRAYRLDKYKKTHIKKIKETVTQKKIAECSHWSISLAKISSFWDNSGSFSLHFSLERVYLSVGVRDLEVFERGYYFQVHILQWSPEVCVGQTSFTY